MSVWSVWRFLFPPPRHAVTWRSTLPLTLFLIVFATVCCALVWTRRFAFMNYWGFLALLSAPWVWWMYLSGLGGLQRLRGLLALLLRLTMVGLFAMALADPRSVRESDKLSVVYALDVSDSIGTDSIDSALDFVLGTTEKKSAKDEAGLVVFARDAAVELPPRSTFPFEALNSRVQRDATDVAKSLSLAAAVLPEENLGRVVLITDGMETEGALDPVLQDLRTRNVSVDVLPISYQYDEEVWLERLELPKFIKLGENYEAGVILSSLKPGKGTLVLQENGHEVSRSEVSYEAGKNRFSIPIYLRQPGYYEYNAVVEPAEKTDHLRENNGVINSVFIRGQGKVLLVTNPEGNSRDWETLREDLLSSDRIVDVHSAFEMPSDPMSFLPYDVVVLANVPADAFDAIQLKALRDSVYDLGIGLIMLGGENSFGPGGYRRTPVEEALPVEMDVSQKKVLPKGALAIILHTCEFAEGNTYGKRITKQAIQVLSDQDEVGVLVYGPSGEEWLFDLTPATEFEMMSKKIAAAEIGDMPSFTTTMQLGLSSLKKSDAAAKHMIIISDGDPSPPPPEMIAEFQQEKISVSMVAIFPHGGSDISKMRAIAETTGGRYYNPSDPSKLPSIFIKEAKTLRRSMIQNKEVTVKSVSSPILKGIDSMPSLKGYVLASQKPRANAVLQVTVTEGGEEQVDPILSTWRFGLGSSAAFTSDLSPNWAANWMDWEKRRAFVAQLLTDVARVEQNNNLHVWTEVQGNEAVIVAEDHHPQDSFLNVTARISGPRERAESVVLQQSGPRRYEASVPLWGKGRYQVMVQGTGGGRQEQVPANWVVSYSPEYLRFRSNPLVLDRIRDVTQGVALDADSDENVIYGRREAKRSTRPIFDWFLVTLACLVPLDVALRRIQVDFGAIRHVFRRKGSRADTTPTMGTLLERKREVAHQWQDRAESKPLTSRPGSMSPQASIRSTNPTPPKTSATPASTSESAPPSTAQGNSSTTEKLLNLKRKRDQQSPP